MSLDSTYIRTDVTAVSLYKDYMLAGIGSSLFIYSANCTKPVQRLVCLQGQKIYGFVHRGSDECLFIVFGGKQFTIVLGPDCSQNGVVVFTRLFEPVVCDDWLHSVLWTPGDNETISVLTAHNVVQKYNITTLTPVSQHSSKDNSILYSGLLLALEREVLVMAGTVYSEVILHICGEDEPLHRLKGHKGVIFSISCYPEKNIIVTTSDDRSVRIWGPRSEPQVPWSSRKYWKVEIICKHELYGHHARVMRSSITDRHIVSVGEDSHLCFWSHDGVLTKKLKRHQNAGIWSIDTLGPLIITGGGDGAVTAQSFSAIDNYHQSDVINLDIGKPKHISYSAGHNLFILNESNRFIFYNTKEAQSSTTLTLEFDTSFHALCVSPNREMCAVAGRKSLINIAIEVVTGDNDLQYEVEFLTFKLEDETILSIHWANNTHLVACNEDGFITVLTVNRTTVDPYTNFKLPTCKERWLTCAAVDRTTKVFIFGDRCGSLHIYKEGSIHPLKSFSKLHGRYGPTSITIMNSEVVTTGRDRTIKYFQITKDELTHTGTKEVDFHWVERFLDVDDNIVCGFKDKMFVVFSLRTNEILLELACGGGHRSWDVLYHYETKSAQMVLNLVYLKKSNINTESAVLSTAVSVAKGSHSKEINCLKTHRIDGMTVFLSGGEDTTLRVSSLDNEMYFEDLAICKNLSSVRTLKMFTKHWDQILLISAGGRAQICIKLFSLIRTNDRIKVNTCDLVDYMLKGTDKQRKGDHNWKSMSIDLEPETRIMDVDYIKKEDKYTIFAGCSDARVRVFVFKADNLTFEMINESNYLQSCILKTVCVNYLNRDILITASTRGEVAFWDATNVDNTDAFDPFFVTRTNKSGINSFVTKNLSDNNILIATGGDDNALHINVLNTPDRLNWSSMQVLHSLVLDRYHSSAITGLCLVDDFMLTTSIDQRITLYVWKVTDKIECDFVYQTFSDVADIKGMDFITQDSSSISVCVFGKGLEVFKIPIPQT